jgi:hypothetical protein
MGYNPHAQLAANKAECSACCLSSWQTAWCDLRAPPDLPTAVALAGGTDSLRDGCPLAAWLKPFMLLRALW